MFWFFHQYSPFLREHRGVEEWCQGGNKTATNSEYQLAPKRYLLKVHKDAWANWPDAEDGIEYLIAEILSMKK